MFRGLASAQYGPSLMKKILKDQCSRTSEEKSEHFLLQKKNSSSLLIQKCGFTHAKMCISTETVMVYSHMKINPKVSCHYASLSHQGLICKIGPLFTQEIYVMS